MSGLRVVLALAATITVMACVVVFAQPKSNNTDQPASPAAPSAPSATAPEPGPPGVPLIEPPPEAPANATAHAKAATTVKACETSGLGGAEPEASAYVVIESAPLSAPGVPTPPHKEVYRGWMYANSPALHPFQHPIYDAWLIACMASAPKA